MYEIQLKNKNQQRNIMIVIAMIVVVGILFFVFKTDSKEKVLKNFYSMIENKQYEDMYTLLDESSKKQYDQETFINRNQNIYEGIEANHISLTIRDRKDDVIMYTVKMDTIAGEVSFDNETTIKNGKICWDDSFIYPSLTADRKVRIVENKAERGRILDRNGEILAGKGKASSVGLVRGKLNGENDYEKLAQLLGMSVEGIQTTMSASWIQDDSFVPLKTVDQSDTELENQLLKIPGVMIKNVDIRSYPYGEITAHLVGYLQKVTAEDLENHQGEGYDENSYIGRSGIEAAYEKQLKGKDGISIDIIENKSCVDTMISQDVENGQDVQLTIDIALQKSLYQAFQNDKSASVAINPTNGEVLALVSTPSFSSNDFILGMSQSKWESLNNDKNQPLLNRFKASWVPGSSMKPLTAAIGLDSHSLDANQDLKAQMKWQKDKSWGNYYVTTLHAPTPNTLKNALIYSDNVYFAKAALQIGKDNLVNGYKTMMIGEDIPFELSLTTSQYTSGDFNDDIQIADSGYGQGQILMNPVQMASLYGAFVNEGKVMTPHVVMASESKVWTEAFSSDTAQEITNDLIGAISDQNGTAHEFYRSDITFAGKTGTGEIKASQDDTTGSEIGWFNVMTVNSHQPLVVSTMVEDVKGRGGSGYVIRQLKNPIYQYLQKD